MGEDGVEGPVCFDERASRLLPDSPHTRDVVRRIPNQGEEIHYSLWSNPEPLMGVGEIDPLLVHRRRAAATRIEKRDLGIDQLIEVLVA